MTFWGLSSVLANGLSNGLRVRGAFPSPDPPPALADRDCCILQRNLKSNIMVMVILHPMARPNLSSSQRLHHIGRRLGSTTQSPRNATRDYPIFCEAQLPWQKGAVENANKRLRRWLCRDTDPNSLSQEELRQLCAGLNATPRKCPASAPRPRSSRPICSDAATDARSSPGNQSRIWTSASTIKRSRTRYRS